MNGRGQAERGGSGMPDRIGDFLVQIGAMKESQVKDVLRVQKQGDARLFGEIAIELGYIDDTALKRYVESKGTPA